MRLLQGLAAAALVGAVVFAVGPFSSSGEPVSVLFVGNSYTTTNDLAGTFSAVAAAGGYDADVEVVAWGGAWLRDHVGTGEARIALTGGDWDFVVIQEQSIVPASATERANAMYPAVRKLVQEATAWDTEPVLFLTWARRDGFPDVGYNSYQPMQRAITDAYEEIGTEVEAVIAPVGEAWSIASRSGFDLYQSDGSHPSAQGTYLAASVLYAAILGEDPTAVDHSGRLDQRTADGLRSIARSVVLNDLDRWRVSKPAMRP